MRYSMNMEISVVIPLYNASKTIVSTINSVLEQSYKVSEIVLINDGSIDNSSDIVRDVFKEYLDQNFIVLIDKRNEGPSAARNIGVKIAKHEWIAFLDSDDQWVYSKIAEQIEVLKGNTNIDVCGTCSNILDFNKKGTFFFVSYRQLLYKNYFSTSSVLLKKESFLRTKGFDESQKYSEDYGLWLEMLFRENICVVLNKKLLLYDVFEEERLSDNSFLMMKGEMLNYKFQFDKRRISFIMLQILYTLSFLKFVKRAF
jgi:glycosyltransferase involved in cell wall biosynthesis